MKNGKRGGEGWSNMGSGDILNGGRSARSHTSVGVSTGGELISDIIRADSASRETAGEKCIVSAATENKYRAYR